MFHSFEKCMNIHVYYDQKPKKKNNNSYRSIIGVYLFFFLPILQRILR